MCVHSLEARLGFGDVCVVVGVEAEEWRAMGEIVSEDGAEQESTMEKMFHSLTGCLCFCWNCVEFLWCLWGVRENLPNLMRTDALSGIVTGVMRSKNKKVVVCESDVFIDFVWDCLFGVCRSMGF